jgi:hypothetical protein
MVAQETNMDNYGGFSGNPQAEWLHNPEGEDRDMRLLADFWYEDPRGMRWTAPTGSVVNGASIPRAFWTLIGSPFTGRYRRASIVHDVACGVKEQPDRTVHRMFYYACRADGVDDAVAKLMYAAIRHFGPKWRTRAEIEAAQVAGAVAAPAPEPDREVVQAQFEAVRAEIAARGEDLSFEELEREIDSQQGMHRH